MLTQQDPEPEPQAATAATSRRAFKRAPRISIGRPRRRPAQDQASSGLTEWHLMTDGQREVAWTQLRVWATWLHDRYELGIEERLPPCWPGHPGLVEELWALKAWREEIYTSSQPSGQAARYWHAELRQVIQSATTHYAAGCRTGHRPSAAPAAEDAELQRRWAAASPLTSIPPADLAASRYKDQPGQWLTPAAMATALDAGQARTLTPSLPGYIHTSGGWWVPGAGGWVRVTDPPFTALLDAWAAKPGRQPDGDGWESPSPGPAPDDRSVTSASS
jgi:hypothetical protein